MITGAHTILYSKHPDELRTFFRDVLDMPSVDAGRGWLIFALPPSEVAMHPGEADATELYLMCDDIERTMKELGAKGVTFSGPVQHQPWGSLASIVLPGGGELGIYEPKHPLAHSSKGGKI